MLSSLHYQFDVILVLYNIEPSSHVFEQRASSLRSRGTAGVLGSVLPGTCRKDEFHSQERQSFVCEEQQHMGPAGSLLGASNCAQPCMQCHLSCCKQSSSDAQIAFQ